MSGAFPGSAFVGRPSKVQDFEAHPIRPIGYVAAPSAPLSRQSGYLCDLARPDASSGPFAGILRTRLALVEIFPCIRQTVLSFVGPALVFLVQGVENRSKFGRAVQSCRFSPRCVWPKDDSSANKREAGYDKRYAQCSHAGHTDARREGNQASDDGLSHFAHAFFFNALRFLVAVLSNLSGSGRVLMPVFIKLARRSL